MKHVQLKKDVGMRLRRVRKKLGFTQSKMVSYFDIGRANYSRIEKGEIFPGAAILQTLRSQFSVSLDWLIAEKGNMFIQDISLEQTEPQELIFLTKYPEEIKELIVHLERVPMVKHALLGYFIEYKLKNKKLIDPILKKGSKHEFFG